MESLLGAREDWTGSVTRQFVSLTILEKIVPERLKELQITHNVDQKRNSIQMNKEGNMIPECSGSLLWPEGEA